MKKVYISGIPCLLLFCIVVSAAFCGVDLKVPYMEQPDDQTCLPTSLSMVLSYMNKAELTTDTVQMLHKQTRYDRYNLPKIVEKYGLYALPCWYELSWNADTIKKELDAGYPVITGGDLFKYGHFFVITGYTDDGKWIINDPTPHNQSYALGGQHNIVEWKDMNWRGGVFIHPTPFSEPEISAKVVKVSAPEIMAPGEMGEVTVTILNNGKKNFPSPVYLECVEPLFDKIVKRKSPFAVKREWLTKTQVASVKSIAPNETTDIVFKIKAPKVEKSTSFREYYNILRADGKRLSDEPGAGHGLFDISPKILVEKKFSQPLPIKNDGGKFSPSGEWSVKYGKIEIEKTGDRENAEKLFTKGKPYDAAWVGDSTWKDYTVEADVFCAYRPDDKPLGWDRAGIFARDNGDHAANVKNYFEKAEYYCMIYDSDDGRIRVGGATEGVIDDYKPKPYLYIKETGWHKFGIQCSGKEISYFLDGEKVHTEKDDTQTSGSCGVFYINSFKEDAKSNGVRFSGFNVSENK